MIKIAKPVMAADDSGGVPKVTCPKCKKVTCICPPVNDPR